MSKFRVTKPNGEQTIIETDVSHSVLLTQYGPSTDIQPIVEEPVPAPAAEATPTMVETVVAKLKRKGKAAE